MAIKSEIVHLSNHLGVRILSTQWNKMFMHNNNQLPVLVLSKNTRFVIKSKTNSNRAVSPPASGKPYSRGLDIDWNGCLPVYVQSFTIICTAIEFHIQQGNQRWQTSPAAPPVCVPNFIVIGWEMTELWRRIHGNCEKWDLSQFHMGGPNFDTGRSWKLSRIDQNAKYKSCRYYIPLHFDTNPESLRPFVPEIWPNNVTVYPYVICMPSFIMIGWEMAEILQFEILRKHGQTHRHTDMGITIPRPPPMGGEVTIINSWSVQKREHCSDGQPTMSTCVRQWIVFAYL